MDIYENPYAVMLDAMRGEGKKAARTIKTGPIEATLTSASPPAVTVPSLNMELDAEDLVVNVDLELAGADVGKTVLLISTQDGQKYYLVCRLS